MFKKTAFEVWRLLPTSGSKRSYQNTGEKLLGTLEPVDSEFAALAGTSFAKSFKIFSQQTSSSVRENDRLVNGFDTYEVKGYQKFDHIPNHIELMVERAVKQ